MRTTQPEDRIKATMASSTCQRSSRTCRTSSKVWWNTGSARMKLGLFTTQTSITSRMTWSMTLWVLFQRTGATEERKLSSSCITLATGSCKTWQKSSAIQRRGRQEYSTPLKLHCAHWDPSRALTSWAFLTAVAPRSSTHTEVEASRPKMRKKTKIIETASSFSAASRIAQSVLSRPWPPSFSRSWTGPSALTVRLCSHMGTSSLGARATEVRTSPSSSTSSCSNRLVIEL